MNAEKSERKGTKSPKKDVPKIRGRKSIQRINAAVKARIWAMRIAGLSIRAIARQEHRDKDTVHKILLEPEFQQFLESQREIARGLIPVAIESLEFALELELNGKLGFAVLTDFGVFESRAKQAG